MTLDEHNKLRLLYVYYATANRNTEVFSWQEICITLDEKGIFEKGICHSKEDLKKSLIIINLQYQSGLYRKYIEYVRENLNYE